MEPKLLDPQSLSEIDKLCYSLMEALMPEQPPLLWHYTNARGLVGILNSKTLRASHITGMNDAYEFRYSKGSLTQATTYALQHATDFSPDDRTMLAALAKSVAQNTVADVPPVFVSCFSTTVDQTNHWGEYGDRGRGYALGFSTADIWKVVNGRDIFLIGCMYDNKTTAELMMRIVVAARTIFKGFRSRVPGVELNAAIEEFVGIYLWNLSYLAPAFKSYTFGHESEWRIVCRTEDYDYARMVFMDKGSEIRPYVDIPLQVPGEKRIPLRQIVLGPCRTELNRELAELAVRGLLDQNGYHDVNIRQSNSTYNVL